MKYLKKIAPFLIALLFIAPSVASAATFTRSLGQGVTGTDVSQLQQFLADEGLYNGPVTAYFGPMTTTAVIGFQEQEGITASGYFGSLTRADANNIITAHPEWTTTLSTNGQYKNVNGNSVQRPAYSSNGTPAGATAQCKDGTYSFSLHHSGTCSGHHGVSQWLN